MRDFPVPGSSLWPLADSVQYLHILLCLWCPRPDPALHRCPTSDKQRGRILSLSPLAELCLMSMRFLCPPLQLGQTPMDSSTSVSYITHSSQVCTTCRLALPTTRVIRAEIRQHWSQYQPPGLALVTSLGLGTLLLIQPFFSLAVCTSSICL